MATAASSVAGWDDDGWFNECQVGHIVSPREPHLIIMQLRVGVVGTFQNNNSNSINSANKTLCTQEEDRQRELCRCNQS